MCVYITHTHCSIKLSCTKFAGCYFLLNWVRLPFKMPPFMVLRPLASNVHLIVPFNYPLNNCPQGLWDFLLFVLVVVWLLCLLLDLVKKISEIRLFVAATKQPPVWRIRIEILFSSSSISEWKHVQSFFPYKLYSILWKVYKKGRGNDCVIYWVHDFLWKGKIKSDLEKKN